MAIHDTEDGMIQKKTIKKMTTIKKKKTQIYRRWHDTEDNDTENDDADKEDDLIKEQNVSTCQLKLC